MSFEASFWGWTSSPPLSFSPEWCLFVVCYRVTSKWLEMDAQRRSHTRPDYSTSNVQTFSHFSILFCFFLELLVAPVGLMKWSMPTVDLHRAFLSKTDCFRNKSPFWGKNWWEIAIAIHLSSWFCKLCRPQVSSSLVKQWRHVHQFFNVKQTIIFPVMIIMVENVFLFELTFASFLKKN